MPRFPLLTGAAAVSAVLAGCTIGNDVPQTQAPNDQAPTSGTEVRVVDNDFEPADLDIATGETVTWTWDGHAAHDVVGDDFDSGVQRDGTFTHTFEEAGPYDYECTLHSGMTGRITVGDA